MILLSFLGPVVASILYVVVFQKAGFRGAILLVCGGPVVSVLSSMVLAGSFHLTAGSMLTVVLITVGLSLAPLLVLALTAWPPVSAVSAQATTENT